MEKYILPTRVLDSKGDIRNINNLFIKKELQIGLNEPVNTVMNGESSILLDFGREICGGIRILICNYDNTPIDLLVRFGESVSEVINNVGYKNSSNDHAIREYNIKTTNLCDLKVGNTGFRFVYIEKKTKDVSLVIKSIVAISVSSNKRCLGKFKCSDEVLNKIYQTCKYTVSLCLQNGYIWDGIKRDRLVWIGDLHPEFLALKCLYKDLKDVKRSLEFVCNETPLPKWMNGIPMYSMWWLIILYDYYYKTNDKELIVRYQDYIVGLVKQLCCYIDDNGNTSYPMNFLDWPSSDSDDLIYGVLALNVITFDKVIKIFSILNIDQNDDLYKLVVNKKDALVNKECKINNKKQVMALYAISKKEYSEDVLKFLIKNNSQGFSTFMSYYILKAIFESNGKKESINLLKEYYNGMLEKGATTFWEDFDINWVENSNRIDEMPCDDRKDIHGDFGKYCYQGYRHSLCHGWSSGPIYFMMKYIAGIYSVDVEDRKVLIKPYLGDLEYVDCSYPTKYGVINVRHTKDENNNVRTKVDHPKEVEVVYEDCVRE